MRKTQRETLNANTKYQRQNKTANEWLKSTTGFSIYFQLPFRMWAVPPFPCFSSSSFRQLTISNAIINLLRLSCRFSLSSFSAAYFSVVEWIGMSTLLMCRCFFESFVQSCVCVPVEICTKILCTAKRAVNWEKSFLFVVVSFENKYIYDAYILLMLLRFRLYFMNGPNECFLHRRFSSLHAIQKRQEQMRRHAECRRIKIDKAKNTHGERETQRRKENANESKEQTK